MELSPSDIRNYEFNTQMRGFDKEEVESFLEQVASTIEDMKQDLLKKTVEKDSLQKQYDDLKQHEDTIKSAAIDARRNADQTVKNAKKEAEELLSDAQTKAENLIHDKAHEFKKIEAQIFNLENTKKGYLTELKKLIASHLTLIDQVADAELELPQVATGELELPQVATSELEVTESTDITVDKMETIANEMSQEESEQETDDEMAGAGKTVTEESLEPKMEEQEDPAPEVPEKENSTVDPELESALQNYQHGIENDKEDNPPPEQPMFGPERVVETTARADDIPEGFIASNQDGLKNSNDTAKIGDQPKTKMNETGPLKPEELAEELDNVAAKFDEVVEKAVKS